MKKPIGLTLLMIFILIASVAFTASPKPTTLLDTPTPTPATTPTTIKPVSNFLKIADLPIVNSSKETIKLFYVDSKGVENEDFTLDAGKKFTSTEWYLGDVEVVRDLAGNLVKVYIATADAKQSITVTQTMLDWAKKAAITTYPELKSLRNFETEGLPLLNLTIINKSIIPLDIYWMNYDGKEQKIGGYEVVAAGKTLTLKTGETHAWRLRDQFGNIILDYITSESPNQTVTITNDVIIASWQTTMTKK